MTTNWFFYESLSFKREVQNTHFLPCFHVDIKLNSISKPVQQFSPFEKGFGNFVAMISMYPRVKSQLYKFWKGLKSTNRNKYMIGFVCLKYTHLPATTGEICKHDYKGILIRISQTAFPTAGDDLLLLFGVLHLHKMTALF